MLKYRVCVKTPVLAYKNRIPREIAQRMLPYQMED